VFLFENAMKTMRGYLRAARRPWLCALSVVLAGAGLLVPGITAAAEGDSLEYAVKATYLYKFGIYVEWPHTSFTSPNSVLNLCIIGDDPFGATLDNAVNGQQVNGHPIAVRRIRTLTPDSGCHVLYVGEKQRSIPATEEMRALGVLTVSDVEGLGIINFVIKDNRVRFNIDEEAASQNGLIISSKLLSLALNVKRRVSAEPK
jgi:hypothetical protein